MTEDIKTIIGLEIHAQLNTKSKMFCRCDNNAQGKAPNTVVCPVCLGMPGTLPVPNREAILSIIKIGSILSSDIAKISKFDRKHYFYPDLPKGYQISQYDMPFCKGGKLQIGQETIRFNRVHLEEDAGKLIHPLGSKHTIVDLNRAGTPLAEMVTEPDITSPQIAKELLKELQIILRGSGVSDADMEKGQMRCDANISVKKGSKSSPIVEIKNLNSFRFVEKALAFESNRLRKEFDSFDGNLTKVTRGFNSKTMETYSMREKEEAKDYRYFPEPDVPPIDLTKEPFASEVKKLKESIHFLPEQNRSRLIDLGLSAQDAMVLVKNEYFLSLVDPIEVAGLDLSRIGKVFINERTVQDLPVESIVDLAKLIDQKSIPSNILRQIINESAKTQKLPSAISEIGKKEIDLDVISKKILTENFDAVTRYKSGKTEVIGFLIGQVMREVQGKADPNDVKETILKNIGG
jgi:aspartyl-tRNA(Asn)/glutamyl-tRNA(Gln) amidotransferase subunit B